MNRNYAEQKITLDFPLKEVKEKINLIIKAGVGTYVSPEINDMMGIYSFNMTRAAVLGCKINITLNRIDEKSTSLSINAKNLGQGNTSDSTLEQFITDFLKVLSLALSGEEITGSLVSANTRGCAGIFLLLIGASLFFSSFLFYSCKKAGTNSFCHTCTSQCGVEYLLDVNGNILTGDTFCGTYRYVETAMSDWLGAHQGQKTFGTSIAGASFNFCAPTDYQASDSIFYYSNLGYTCK